MSKNTKQDTKKSSFKFGRNPLSFIIVVGSLIILFFAIFIPVNYIVAYNDRKVTAFVDGDPSSLLTIEEYQSAEKVKLRDFHDFDLSLVSVYYNGASTSKTLKVTANFFINEYTKTLSPEGNSFNMLHTAICASNDWAGTAIYSNDRNSYFKWSKYATYREDGTVITSQTTNNVEYSITSFSNTIGTNTDGSNDYSKLPYPVVVPCFPGNVVVTHPNIYFYFKYSYQNQNASEITRAVIVEITHPEYNSLITQWSAN